MTLQEAIPQILRAFAKKGGLEDAKIENILSSGEIEEGTVKSLTTLPTLLHSHESAIADTRIRNAVMGSTLGEIDNKILQAVKNELGLADRLGEDTLKEIADTRNTSDKVIKLVSALEELRKAELSSHADERYNALNDELEKARGVITQRTNDYETLKQELSQTRENYRLEGIKSKIKSYLSEKELNAPTPQIAALITQEIVSKALGGAHLVQNEGGEIEVFNSQDNTLRIYDEKKNLPITSADYLDSFLAPYLKANNGGDTPPVQPTQRPVAPVKEISPGMQKAIEANKRRANQ